MKFSPKSYFLLGATALIAIGLTQRFIHVESDVAKADMAKPVMAEPVALTPEQTKAATEPLRWAPPTLDNPITLQLEQGLSRTKLQDDRDYILELPADKKVGGLIINGGHNVVIKGGYITVPPGGESHEEHRALQISNSKGTVHIEGVLIDNSSGGESDFDGVVINAPEATVQLQNMRIVGLTGSHAGFHSDIVQPWGGVKELRIDRMTGTSNYQGFQIPADKGAIESATLQNINLGYVPRTEGKNGFLLWMTTGAKSCNSYPITLSNFYLEARPGQDISQSAWPPPGGNLECAGVRNGDEVSWPKLPVTGVVKQGPPASGDFVPAGIAGLNYKSPGYAKSEAAPGKTG